ncbi:MAG TPA: hypothetical protein VFN68_00115 [Acidimicrobiales bacterium]|nr:hypothetical protein [Acidimicrobiales bacterium]
MARRPVLASSCAVAATAAEARFRIDRPIDETRRTTVIALDRGAEHIAAGAAPEVSERVRFYNAAGDPGWGGAGAAVEGSDLVILVATPQLDRSTAAAVGRVCGRSRIPTFGLVVGRPLERAGAVSALRDQTAMLMASETPLDLADILSDLRA